MKKIFLFITILILIISFSAGIFVEISASPHNQILSFYSSSVIMSIYKYIKQDIFIVFLYFLCSCTVILFPAIIIAIIYNFFSLGYSASYILTTCKSNGIIVIIISLLPRYILKLPVYMYLMYISAKFIGEMLKGKSTKQYKEIISRYIIYYVKCLIILIISSIFEVFLLQIIH